jgi:hypothetical protein
MERLEGWNKEESSHGHGDDPHTDLASMDASAPCRRPSLRRNAQLGSFSCP